MPAYGRNRRKQTCRTSKLLIIRKAPNLSMGCSNSKPAVTKKSLHLKRALIISAFLTQSTPSSASLCRSCSAPSSPPASNRPRTRIATSRSSSRMRRIAPACSLPCHRSTNDTSWSLPNYSKQCKKTWEKTMRTATLRKANN